MKPVCHIVAGPNGAGKSTFALDCLPEYAGSIEYVNPAKMSKEDREVQEASDAATLTVDEALRTRDDYDRRRQALADELAWIARGRASSRSSRSSIRKRPSR